MRGYEAMRLREPDFFLHSGDTIYADGPILAEQIVEDGKPWRNIVTPDKSKVAATLDEYRGNYRYNLLDENVLRADAQVPQIWQWDDTRSSTTGQRRRISLRTRATPPRTSCSWSLVRRRRSRSMRRCARSATKSASVSTARSHLGRCSMCSSSTCVATAVELRQPAAAARP